MRSKSTPHDLQNVGLPQQVWINTLPPTNWGKSGDHGVEEDPHVNRPQAYKYKPKIH
jgi:hypothetical protein